MYVHFYVLGLLALFLLVGFLYRLSAALFFPPDWPRRVFNWRRAAAAETSEPSLLPSLSAQRATMALLALYLGVQVLVPLRHWLYPGSAHWTEEGHRFSWHMKLRDKEAVAEFTVKDPESGTTRTVYPLDYITPRQNQEMATRPDMILRFAHHLAERERKNGRQRVEVYASVEASLNGRPPQLLIDAAVDLAAQERTIWGASPWIVPLREPLPPVGARAEPDSAQSEP